MALTSTILRWRARQRREVWQSLWMHAPFTAVEARRLCRQIAYSPLKAARIIRAHEQDMRRIERGRAVEAINRVFGRCTSAHLFEHFGVETEADLLNMPAANIRARCMEFLRKHDAGVRAEAERLAKSMKGVHA